MSRVGGKWNVASNKAFETPVSRIRGMIWDGIHYLRSSSFGLLVFLKASTDLIGGAIDVLNVSLSERGKPELRATRLGVLFASIGVGCILGPIISDRFAEMEDPKTMQRFCLYGFVVVSLGCFAMGMVNQFDLICFFSAVRSMGASVVWVNSSLLLQKFSSVDMLGRVTSIEYSTAIFAEALSAVAAGILQDEVGLDAEQVVQWLGVFATVLALFWSIYHYKGLGAGKHRRDSEDTLTETTSEEMSDVESAALLPDSYDS